MQWQTNRPTTPPIRDFLIRKTFVPKLNGCSASAPTAACALSIAAAFPKLFDAIDDYCVEGKYADVNTKNLKPADVDTVVDLCFQCKLCYIKCPYTPGDHEWAIDFPRLMNRAKSQAVKKNGVPLVDKLLGNPDLVGKVGTMTAPLANWGNENPLNRQLMESVVGIHKDKKLPPFASQTFAAQFNQNHKAPAGEPAASCRLFLDLLCELQSAGDRQRYARSDGAQQRRCRARL